MLERAGRIAEAREALERALAVWERKRCLPYVVRLREQIAIGQHRHREALIAAEEHGPRHRLRAEPLEPDRARRRVRRAGRGGGRAGRYRRRRGSRP